MKLSRKKSRVLAGIAVVVLAIVLLNVFQKEMRGFFYYFSSPIQKVFFKAGKGTADFLAGVFRAGDLKKELDELKNKNQELSTKIIALESLEEENKILREALGLEFQKKFKISLAQVIGKDISQDFLLIDKGAKDNVLKNMPVITQQKVLVGRISEVYDKFSKVMLISHKNSSFNVVVTEQEELSSSSTGVVRGEGNLKILFDLIPKEKEIFAEELVFTSALGGIFPEGLLVGKIKEVKKSDVEPFQQAEISPAFDISNIDKLFIILEW